MIKINKILAGMAFGPQDGRTAKYLDAIGPLLQVQEICNFHVFLSEYLYNELNIYSPGLGSDSLNLIEEKMNERLKDSYKHVPKTYSEVVLGTPLQKLMDKAKAWQADLIALGKPQKGHSTLAKNVIRHIDCNTLIVPEKAPSTLSHIMVPLDLSEHSGKVLQVALDIQKKAGKEIKITCFHAYDIPNFTYPYYDVHGTLKEFEDEFKLKVKKDFRKFIDKYINEGNPKIEKVLVEELIVKPSQYILEYINENDVDLVVMGAKSHSGFAAFLGSTVEKVITKNDKAALLIIK